jgi:hypothetical protein
MCIKSSPFQGAGRTAYKGGENCEDLSLRGGESCGDSLIKYTEVKYGVNLNFINHLRIEVLIAKQR